MSKAGLLAAARSRSRSNSYSKENFDVSKEALSLFPFLPPLSPPHATDMDTACHDFALSPLYLAEKRRCKPRTQPPFVSHKRGNYPPFIPDLSRGRPVVVAVGPSLGSYSSSRRVAA